MRRVSALVSLVKRFGVARVDATARRALDADMHDVDRLRRMLEAPVVDGSTPLARVAARPPPAATRHLGDEAPHTRRRNAMRTTNPLDIDLRAALKKLKFGKMLDTLPERLAIAKQQKMGHQELLLLILHDEISRRESAAAASRSERAHLDPEMQLERWDSTAKVNYDKDVWNDLVTLRFLDEHAHVAIVGPVGTGKTFLAHALGHVAARRGHSVLAISADQMLKGLKDARLDSSHGHEMKKLVAVDLLIVDDFALDVMDQLESRDVAELMGERHRAGSVSVTSNRGSDEWSATFADPVRAQNTIDRVVNNAYDLVIDGESYRLRLKPGRRAGQKPRS